jgi:hypothetical protein
MDAVEVTLPTGVRIGDHWARHAWLRPVTGREEEFLLFEGRHLSAAARTTQLLTRCLLRVGPTEPVTADLVRRMTAGDREALLLHIRCLTLGGHISCLLSCVHCKQKMDLDLEIAELLLAPYPHQQEVHETAVEGGYRIRFRIPNGEDQEFIAGAQEESVDSTAEALLARCIEQVLSPDGAGAGSSSATLSAAVLDQLSVKIAALDPQAEILLDLACPECGAQFMVPFDTGDFFFRELAGQERQFYRELHVISLHYHWSEEAALSLSRRKRQTYFELLADERARGGRQA